MDGYFGRLIHFIVTRPQFNLLEWLNGAWEDLRPAWHFAILGLPMYLETTQFHLLVVDRPSKRKSLKSKAPLVECGRIHNERVSGSFIGRRSRLLANPITR